MAATIKIKNSSTTGSVPSASNLVQGELAVNVTDLGLYTENASGTVVKLNAPSIDDKNTGATKHLTISTGGNLGLGVTPSAWGSGQKAIQLGAAASINGSANTSQAIMSANRYYNGTNDIYINTAAASLYQQISGAHQWYNAGSGTAGNAITFTQAMTLDASGNLGIGNTAPLTKLVVGAAQTLPDSSTNVQLSGSVELCQSAAASYRAQFEVDSSAMYIGSNTYYSGGWQVYDSGRAPAQLQMVSNNLNSYISFFTSAANSGNGTERARIDSSGNWLTGTTSNGGAGGLSVSPSITNGAPQIVWNRASTTGTSYASDFRNAGTTVGYIAYTNTTVTYNTGSDYRLKENIQPMTGALAKVAALKPVTYTWKADGSAGEGFIAHELQAVVPQCVTGEKDAVDADGNPVYQGIDTSFLVATLVAAIQELKAEVDALKGTK